MNRKTSIVVVIAVAVIFGLVMIYMFKAPATNPPGSYTTPGQPAPGNQTTVPFEGSFEKLVNNKIYFKSGSDEKIAVISSETKIIKQSMNNGKMTMTTMKATDLKSGELINVYYQTVNSDASYNANLIQVIN